MNDRLIITLPISPYDKMSVGKMTTPILGESLAKSMDCNFIMAINVLNSYKNKKYDSFIKLLNYYQINPNKYWIDNHYVKELINKIYLLNEMGYICEKEKEVMTCNCGKVEIDKENINTINMNDSLFEIKDEKYYCKFCNKQCYVEKNKCFMIF